VPSVCLRLAGIVVVVALLSSCASTSSRTPTPVATIPVTPISTPTPQPRPIVPWELDHPAAAHQLEGYATATSVNPGNPVGLMISAKAASYTGAVYRMGWANGAGADLVGRFGPITGVRRAMPNPGGDGTSVVANWPTSVTVQTKATWQSGMYMVKLTDSTGAQSYIPFVVRDATGASILFVDASLTSQAYNSWGGVSLYEGSTPQYQLNHGVQVSFERPYTDDFGAGQFFFWEYQMARFLEREGYNVGYTDDVAIAQNPAELLHHKVVLIAGHDEYWSLSMRDGYDNAVAHGVNLLVFGGNTGYRHVRLQSDSTGPDRIVICYKSAADPLTASNPRDSTVQWRSPPTNRPESELLGAEWIATGNTSSQPWIVSDSSNWIYSGTGVRSGRKLYDLLGYEEDGVVAGAPHPSRMSAVSASPIQYVGDGGARGKTLVANGTVSMMSSGAIVVNIGSVQWSWGLDSFISPEIVKGTRAAYVSDKRPEYVSTVAQEVANNVLSRALIGRLPAIGPASCARRGSCQNADSGASSCRFPVCGRGAEIAANSVVF
jgi:hypothetical protein